MRFNGYYILTTDPTVAICKGEFQPLPEGRTPPLPDHIRPDVILEHLTWCCVGGTMSNIARRYEASRNDGIRRLVLPNTPEEMGECERFGLEAIRAPTTVYISENDFRPVEEKRTHDAVYTARLAPFKRFHLASLVNSLKVLTGGSGAFSEDCARLPHADYEMTRLGGAAVARNINRSGCGLALSAEEGIMQGSLEYLLCGKPVVSTPSAGGRDMFYDAENSIIVGPTPESVRDGVREALQRTFDHRVIRRNALAFQESDRYRLCRGLTALILDMGGPNIRPEAIYAEMFIDTESFHAGFIETISRPQPTSVSTPTWKKEVCFVRDEEVYVDQDESFCVVCRGENLLQHLDPFQLNVLQLCAQRRTVSSIIEALSPLFPGERDPDERVRDAIARLVKAGALHTAGCLDVAGEAPSTSFASQA